MSALRYTEDHEWIRMDGDIAVVGITDYAQEQLGDLVFVELPDVGTTVAKQDDIVVVESVKAASDVYSPMDGEIVEINDAVVDDPSLVNKKPDSDGWLFKIRPSDASQLEAMLDEAAYKALID